MNAARTGHVTSDKVSSKKRDHLVLIADENLLHMLESPEWGRPVALANVFVRLHCSIQGMLGLVSLTKLYDIGRGDKKTKHGSFRSLQIK